MKIRVFQSDKGDCLMLTSKTGANLLVDGGMKDSFVAHVQPHLGKMAKKGEKIDLVYVSHIDQDHIAGILKLLDTTMAWRVHNYRASKKLSSTQPADPVMPEVKGIWHNAFSKLVEDNAGPAQDLLAQSSRAMALSSFADWQDEATDRQELAYSINEAIQVSQRIGAEQLNIPLNKEFDGRLILVREPSGAEAKIGEMSIKVIGPFEEDVEKLRDDWNEWLIKEKAVVEKLFERAAKDAEKIGQAGGEVSEIDIFLKTQLGKRSAVTPPNLASIMLLVEEGATKVLLTGDGHWEDAVAGLEHQGAFDSQGLLKVAVVKMLHHGSKNNVEEEFYRRVQGDHYIFCGNGEHGNPHLDVVELLFSANQKYRPNHKYKVWFNCDSSQAPAGKPREHMKKLEAAVGVLVASSKGTAKAFFLSESSFELKLT